MLSGLEFLLDDARNRAARPDAPARLSPDGATVPIWLIPADEGRQIARDVFDLLRGGAAG